MKVSQKRRFDARDWQQIADYACDTLDKRKNARKDIEKVWKEVDRQIAMTPDIRHKLKGNGQPDPSKAWMPELELPLQAQALEMLTADSRRMMFPDAGPWFEAHANLSDEYLARVDFSALVSGDLNEVPTLIDQDAADKLVAGILNHWHRQYDFFSHIDAINAEAFKYGMGVGRGRVVSKRIFLNTAKGVTSLEQKIPVLVPMSIKSIYPDDSKHHLMSEGHMVGPSVVREWKQLLADVVMAAEKGSKNPDDENGGWMPRLLQDMDAEEDGTVTMVEMEGDFIVPRKTTGSMYLPNAIVTIVIGRRGKQAQSQVVRFRFKRHPFSSFLWFPYHSEHIDCAYPTSPLIKGWPIQAAAVNSMSRLIEAGALNTQPPLQYDADDPAFAQNGGPSVFPGAQWGTTGDIIPRPIGDPSAMFAIYAGLLNQYADTTGMNAPRLGAQTVSHTTAFAKDMEMQRGVIRTVDYVRTSLKGGLTKWLQMAYVIGRDVMKSETVYIDAYNGYVDVDKQALPDAVTFEVHGSGGPQEQAMKEQRRMQSLQTALQMDTMSVQMGNKPELNLPALINQTLRQGGWSDVDVMLNQEAEIQQAPEQMPGLITQGPM